MLSGQILQKKKGSEGGKGEDWLGGEGEKEKEIYIFINFIFLAGATKNHL